ncbi:MAG TPA: ABC transporter permease [Streptosporangiaceae bacterium]|jgi:osmoprotectant transport system permease protein|nr:ABC transporter permease [Streptosporangiaceae bacterium]
MSFFSFAWQWLSLAHHWSGSNGVPARLIEHLEYTVLAMAIASVIALPAGVLMGHTGRGGFTLVSIANVWRSLPTLGLLVLAFISSGGASWAWLIPLVVLAIPPIMVTTYEGVLGVDADLKDAAAGMGMTSRQVLFKVEVPVALPLILLGLRTAAIQVVATATIAAYISLGGFGRYIIDGLATNNYQLVAAGAACVVVLALVVQFFFAGLGRLIVSAGLRQQARQS